MAISNQSGPVVSPPPGSSKGEDKNGYSGMRKLIRPQLPPGDRRREPVREDDPLSHAMISDQHGVPESSHAEVFYFQKQMQQQTEMTVVLEDGEELHGVIQWFDKCSIKLRVGRQRVMVYKSCIKYLYKGSEAAALGSVMK